MATTRELVDFDRADPAPVLAVMAELAARGDGGGWINIGPALSDEEAARVPARSGLAAWFSGRGPAVPMGTWTPPVTSGRVRAAQVGVEHGTGPNALDRLAAAGAGLPSGWVKRQDHAKHGIVADVPADADPEAVVTWIVSAVTALSTTLALGHAWIAVVHRAG